MSSKRLDRIWKKVLDDSVRIRVPKSFLPTLALFLHHVSDAMGGDDRPDHGLAKMRQDRDTYRYPFHLVYATVRRAEKRMTPAQHQKAWKQFEELSRVIEEDDRRFRKKLKLLSGSKEKTGDANT